MLSDDRNNSSGILKVVIAPVLVALLVGGSAPWWWSELFPSDDSRTTTTTTTTTTAGSNPPSTTEAPPTTAETTAAPQPETTGCSIVIANRLIDLSEEPANFAQSILRIPPGTYAVEEARDVDFGGLVTERWLRITVEGRSGWVKDDTFTVSSKQDCNF